MTRGRLARLLLVLAATLGIATLGCSAEPTVPTWDPAAFAPLRTLQFLSVGPEEGPHWSTVWLVVLDGDVYIRLGSRAADRMRRNTTTPHVGVRIGGREYPTVRAEERPAMAARVAAAMADKYAFDVLVRRFEHPFTMRLILDATGAGS